MIFPHTCSTCGNKGNVYVSEDSVKKDEDGNILLKNTEAVCPYCGGIEDMYDLWKFLHESNHKSREEIERAEYERLKKIYGNESSPPPPPPPTTLKPTNGV